MTISAREKFISVISNDPIRKSDAIVLLEGDGLSRINEAARLYKAEFAPVVVISGGAVNPPDSITASEMQPHLVSSGVPESAIVLEEKSKHTRDQAVFMMEMAVARGWKSLIIVASNFHQYRAYLTFLRAMQERNLELYITNAPARDLPWFGTNPVGIKRVDLLDGEFERIEKYGKDGHIATFEEALNYQEWKESQ